MCWWRTVLRTVNPARRVRRVERMCQKLLRVGQHETVHANTTIVSELEEPCVVEITPPCLATLDGHVTRAPRGCSLTHQPLPVV